MHISIKQLPYIISGPYIKRR